MFQAEMCARDKMAIEEVIVNGMKEINGDFDGRCMAIPSGLADHIVYRPDKKVELNEIEIDEHPEYIMFLERCKMGPFGPKQTWEVFTFSFDEIKSVANATNVFSSDEIEAMEPFEHFDEL